MHAVITSMGSVGDVNPMLGIGQELKRRGHRVTVVTGETSRGAAERADIEFHMLYSKEEEDAFRTPFLQGRQLEFLRVHRRLQKIILRRNVEYLCDVSVPGETLLMSVPWVLSPEIASDKLGLPLVTINSQAALLPSRYAKFDDRKYFHGGFSHWFRMSAFARAVDLIDGGSINKLRADFGVHRIRKLFFEHWMSRQLVLTLLPEWFFPPQPDWPPKMEMVGFPLFDQSAERGMSTELTDFLDAGDPPIVFSRGSYAVNHRDFFRESVEATVQLKRRAILLTPYPEQLPANLPDGIRHFDYVPYTRLLPRVAAHVHHAGIGTCAQDFAAGIPQLCVPENFDQPVNSRLCRRHGVAEVIRGKAYRADRVVKAMSSLLYSEKVAERCAHFAELMKGHDSFKVASDHLEAHFDQANRKPVEVGS